MRILTKRTSKTAATAVVIAATTKTDFISTSTAVSP